MILGKPNMRTEEMIRQLSLMERLTRRRLMELFTANLVNPTILCLYIYNYYLLSTAIERIFPNSPSRPTPDIIYEYDFPPQFI